MIYFIVLLAFSLSILQLIVVFSQTGISNEYEQLTRLYPQPYQGDDGLSNLQDIISAAEFVNISCPVKKKLRSQRLPPIALATFPGSGTTWMRYLIEESTGYLTATIYNRDNENFEGSSLKDGRVIAIKTHFIYNEFKSIHPSMLDYGKAIVLLRHPRGSIIAEVNREFSDNPLGFMEKSWNDSQTLTYQAHLARRWPNFVKGWLNSFPRPKLVVIYEQLHTHRTQILNAIADFLNVPILEEGMHCLQQHPEGYALRSKNGTRPKHLHPSIENIIQQGLKQTYSTLIKYGIQFSLDS